MYTVHCANEAFQHQRRSGVLSRKGKAIVFEENEYAMLQQAAVKALPFIQFSVQFLRSFK